MVYFCRMRKAEETKQYIIERSAVLFNQKGYAGTSLKDIIAATGLSKGGIYGNFEGGKDEIAVAAFDYAVGLVTAKVRERTRVIDNTLDKLKSVVYFYKERVLNPPVEGGCPIQNTAVEADDNNVLLRQRVIEAMDDWRSRIIYTIQKGIKKGEIKPTVDAEEFATQFIGTLEGGIMMAQLYKNIQPFDTMARQLLRMIEDLRVEVH